jgi:hypothetical protein
MINKQLLGFVSSVPNRYIILSKLPGIKWGHIKNTFDITAIAFFLIKGFECEVLLINYPIIDSPKSLLQIAPTQLKASEHSIILLLFDNSFYLYIYLFIYLFIYF